MRDPLDPRRRLQCLVAYARMRLKPGLPTLLDSMLILTEQQLVELIAEIDVALAGGQESIDRLLNDVEMRTRDFWESVDFGGEHE